MELIKKYITRENLIIFTCFTTLLGLFTTNFFRALPSISLILLLVFCLARKDIFQKLPSFFHYKNVFFILSLSFFLHLPYFFTTDSFNLSYYIACLERRVPFLGIGLALFFAPKISPKIYLYFIYVFLVCTFLSAFGSIINYIINFDAINKTLDVGKPLPVIVNHVRYSLFTCFGIFCGFYLYKKEFSVFGKSWEKYISLGMGIFLIVFSHLSGVRSGLLAFYVIIGLAVLYFIIKEKKIVLGLSIAGGTIMLIVCMVLFSPRVQQKIKTTFEDLETFDDKNEANYNSLHNRVVSYEVGMMVWEKGKIFGVGSGNLEREVYTIFSKDFQHIFLEKRIMPHSQYIYYGAAYGIVGLCIFLFSFYAPLFMNKNYKDLLFTIHYIIISISFLVEATLETQLGSLFCFVFIFFPLYFLGNNESHSTNQKELTN